MTRWTHALLRIFALALLAPALALATPTPPSQLAHQTVSKVLNAMKGRREELRQHPQKLYQLINKDLVPLIDLPYMSQLVLGRYWRQATPEQRKRFETAFKNMLIQSYGQALLAFKDKDQVKYLPVRAPADAKDVTFHARIQTSDGQDVPVTLKMHLVDGQWKVYDGSVGNLSFVTNYRGQFNSQIQRHGLEQLIKRMEQRYNPGHS